MYIVKGVTFATILLRNAKTVLGIAGVVTAATVRPAPASSNLRKVAGYPRRAVGHSPPREVCVRHH
jgi:hypothetical protein